jgi:hypothetical protein
VDVPAASPQELVRPWRTATLVAVSIAAVELVLLLATGTLLLAKPLSRAIRGHAEATAIKPLAHSKPAPHRAQRTTASASVPKLTRAKTHVIVFNGNGRDGAAAEGAARLHRFGYAIAGTGNARRQDYAATVVMYKPGFRAEALRLARDLNVKVVGPLDGLKPSALMGGQLAVVLGA